jgi:putative SOS response-associated peptidase YedK
MARPDNRCLVPFTSFSEYDTIDGKKVPVWFAIDEKRPLLALAGIWSDLDLRAQGKKRQDYPLTPTAF